MRNTMFRGGLHIDPRDAAAAVGADAVRTLYPRGRLRNVGAVRIAHDKPLRPAVLIELVCAADHRQLLRLER